MLYKLQYDEDECEYEDECEWKDIYYNSKTKSIATWSTTFNMNYSILTGSKTYILFLLNQYISRYNIDKYKFRIRIVE